MIGWRPALRIAWRDALRHRGRSILVLVMISLPVLAVSAAAVVLATSDVSGIERAERRLGAADARVLTEGRGRVLQAPDPSDGEWTMLGEADYDDPSPRTTYAACWVRTPACSRSRAGGRGPGSATG